MKNSFEVKHEEKTYYVHTYDGENGGDIISIIYPEKDNCCSIGGMNGVILTPETLMIWLEGYTNGIETGIKIALTEIEDSVTELRRKYFPLEMMEDDYFDEYENE